MSSHKYGFYLIAPSTVSWPTIMKTGYLYRVASKSTSLFRSRERRHDIDKVELVVSFNNTCENNNVIHFLSYYIID